jgi:lipopolysaccharide/colanic/teichoic acid biosynthesis glycosyltransferase
MGIRNREAGVGRLNSRMKRPFDLTLALMVSVIAIPVLGVVACLVRFSSGAPVFYRSTRVGLGGREFGLLKLRTMVQGADQDLRGSVTHGDDPRVTSLGRRLRRWKLDELPQVFNVFAGDMSFVGWRADTPEYVALYTHDQREILRYLPGITSPASIAFVNEEELLKHSDDPRATYLNEIMPEELRIDLEYLRTATVLSDLCVILKTVAAILNRGER